MYNILNNMDRALLLIAKDDEFGRKLQDLALPTRRRAPKRGGVTMIRTKERSMSMRTGERKSLPCWGICDATLSVDRNPFSFEYDPAWLASAEGPFSLDPDLALFRGRQYVPLDKRLFVLFADSCPDRGAACR